MKAKAFILGFLLVFGIMITSCSGSKNTCPAYKSKINTDQQKEVKS